MMGKITDVTLAETANEFVAMIPSADPDTQTFEEAAKQDPIALGHAVVWSISQWAFKGRISCMAGNGFATDCQNQYYSRQQKLRVRLTIPLF
jgi:hypothetical protein